MTNGLPGRLLQRREDPRRASFLELFFDLAIIFALTRLSRTLLSDLTVHGGFRVLLLLAAIWWVWFVTAWSADWFDPRTSLIVVLLLWVMFGGLLMAAAVPTAFDAHAMVFALAYVSIHLGRAFLLIPALRGHPLQLRTARVAIWFAVSGVLWVVGAAVAPARELLWALALILDYTMARLGWPTPRLGRSSWPDLQVNGEHLSERYQQIFIIALGELILISGITYSDSGLDRESTMAFAVAFLTAVALARLYLSPAGGRLGAAIEAAGPPGSRLALQAGYLHLVMIAGVLATSVGMELTIGDPGSSAPARLTVVVAGPVLFLIGRLLLSAVIDGSVSRPRLIGLAIIVLGGFASAQLPLLGAAAIITALFLLMIVAEALLDRRERRRAAVADGSPDRRRTDV
ncbi:low temperature requirement protein A [Micromonospora sp. NPDC049301]|uniref:low temperature requirement protein A n=1 Tax=Micromonospora sp. NPDC049301 TaxID=3155723 RepID=UPI00342D2A98